MTEQSPIFIVGCPRSGTSLLRDLLRSHPRLTFPNESHFIPAFYRGYGDPQTERQARRLAGRILALHWVRDWRLPLVPEDFSGDRTFRRVVSRLFESYAEREGKARWGDKTPHYITEIPALHQVFQDCRIIHIYRDGRDVALSWLQVGFQPRNLFTAARLWRSYVRAGRRDGGRLPPECYTEVRYEELLAHPEATMVGVCKFVGEPFDPSVLVPNFMERVRRRKIFGKRRPPRLISRRTIVADNYNLWMQAMSPAERALFESVAGDLLEELGYPTEGLARPLGRLEAMRWGGHQKCWWALSRLNTIGSSVLLRTDLQMRWARLRSRLPRH